MPVVLQRQAMTGVMVQPVQKLSGGFSLHRGADRGVPAPQIIVRVTIEQIVAFSATDHGENGEVIQLYT